MLPLLYALFLFEPPKVVPKVRALWEFQHKRDWRLGRGCEASSLICRTVGRESETDIRRKTLDRFLNPASGYTDPFFCPVRSQHTNRL